MAADFVVSISISSEYSDLAKVRVVNPITLYQVDPQTRQSPNYFEVSDLFDSSLSASNAREHSSQSPWNVERSRSSMVL